MSFIKLRINKPKHNAAFNGRSPLRYDGSPQNPQDAMDVKLYFRWYASSFSRVIPKKNTNGSITQVIEQYSINNPALLTPLYDPAPDLGIGSHVITFAVSDSAGENESAFSAIQHAGVTGGSKGDNACIIHVFKSNIIKPSESQQVSRLNMVLQAEAPPLWNKKQYQDINRLAYRWLLVPDGVPAGRPSVDTSMLATQPKFAEKTATTPAMLTYELRISDVNFAGKYSITLRVSDNTGQIIGEDSKSVTVFVGA